jgi:hypothetical protein
MTVDINMQSQHPVTKVVRNVVQDAMSNQLIRDTFNDQNSKLFVELLNISSQNYSLIQIWLRLLL